MPRIKLVMARAENYGDFYRIRSSPSDIYWNGYTKKPDFQSFKLLYLKRINSSPFNNPEDRKVFFVLNECDVVIGFTQLIRHENCIEIGYTIVERYQGKGYATEALIKTVPIAQQYFETVIVRIRDDNVASQRVALKAGFVRTDEYIEHDYPKAGIVKLRTYAFHGMKCP